MGLAHRAAEFWRETVSRAPGIYQHVLSKTPKFMKKPGLWVFVFVAFFSAINLHWGNKEFDVFGREMQSQAFVWFWIFFISLISGANISPDGGSRHNIWLVICLWWTANIGMTELLNAFGDRPVGEAGQNVFGVIGLTFDFVCQGAIDFLALRILWELVKREIMEASAWLLIFGLYLVANIAGHAVGAFGVAVGYFNLWPTVINPDSVAAAYDAYMFMAFTVLLVIQVGGSSGDCMLRRVGSSLDIYTDMRPLWRRVSSLSHYLS